MSRSALCTGVFGAGVQRFQLRIGELEELQEACDAGPEEIFWRLNGSNWRVADLREPIRLGLIGAGMLPTEALVMVDRYCQPGWLSEWKSLAAAIVGAAINGAPDEDAPPGETTGEGPTPAASPAAKSASATSTGSAAPSATRRRKSRAAASGSSAQP